MQSFLQYRRAGVQAQAQIDRDIGKAQTSNPTERPHAEPVSPAQEEKRRSLSLDSPGGARTEVGSERLEENLAVVERSQTARTQCSEGTALGRVLTGIHVRDRTVDEGHEGRVFVVGWAGPHDALDPHNWSTMKRIGVTLQISVIALFVGAASGIDATVLPQASREFGVSEVAESLATGMFYTHPVLLGSSH